MNTNSTDLKMTPSYLASEVFSLRTGFGVLNGLLHDLREMDDITAETIDRLIWTADHIRAELGEIEVHAEALADDERAAVAARRSVTVLQAAE
jgi:hypothetical protein